MERSSNFWPSYFLIFWTLFGGDVPVGFLVSVALCLPISIVAVGVTLPLVFKFGSTKALQMVPLIMTMLAGVGLAVVDLGILCLSAAAAVRFYEHRDL